MTANPTSNDLKNLPAGTRRGVLVWLRKQVVFLLLLAVMLFWSAGTLRWTWGWVQLGLYVIAVAAQALILIPRSPGLIAERAELQKGTKRWDVAISVLAAVVLPIMAWVVAGLDVRFGWTPEFAVWVHVVGAVAWLAGYALTIWAMLANAYFSATVRIQADRDHQVVTGGPYRFVRHPGYVGALLTSLVTPLLLGSWWAMVPSAAAALLFVVRTALEDRTLRDELPGYEAFTRQTRYRLLPGIW